MNANETWPALVAGEWVEEGEGLEVRSPWDGSLIATVRRCGADDFRASLAAADEAFRETRALPSHERARILAEAAARVVEGREPIARTMVGENGKPVKHARAEVDRCALTLRTAAEETARIGGEWLSLDSAPWLEGRAGLVRRFPLGPVGAITPFNFPLNLVAHKLAPAIAVGNPVVVKPASQTPLSALRLARILAEAGWPKGALSVLPAPSSETHPLVEDGRSRLLTFTGSSEVGWELKARAGRKRVALELGGNAACVVCADGDLAGAAAACAAGGFAFAGQSCISVQRILVETAAYDEFRELLLEETGKLKTGDPDDEETDVGPLISRQDAERVEAWIGEAVEAGARLLCGGEREGSVVTPAVLEGTDAGQKVERCEIFGPVVTLNRFAGFDEALERVNDSDFGLQAGIYTADVGRAVRAFEELDVGGVVLNGPPTFRADPQPYGGSKGSGTGREGVRYAIEEMTEMRVLLLPSGRP